METPQNARASALPATKHITRRHVTAGLAWSAPALALTVAAPAQAASFEPCGYTVDFEATPGTGDKVSQFEAVSDTGQIITVVVQSTSTSCTTLTSANFSTRSDYALASRATTTTCAEEYQPTGAPSGYLTLNQHAPMNGCTRVRNCGTYDGHPTQDVTLTFLQNGAPVQGISSLELDVYDISGVMRDGSAMGDQPSHRWSDQYKDTVGFSQAPSAIVPFDAAAAGLNPSIYGGVGAGTYASPYQRVYDHAPTVRGVSIKDTFIFGDLAGSSITMRYSNAYYGYQFIALAGIRFSGPCI